jgi:hypothetical protein
VKEEFKELSEYLTPLTGFFHEYMNQIYADESLSDVDVLLLSIYLTDREQGKVGARYDKCKEKFRRFGRQFFRQTVYQAQKRGLIRKENNNLYLLVKGVKRLNELLGQKHMAPVYVIKAGEIFSGVKFFEEFLAKELNGDEILICDPYISSHTLYPFTILKGKIKKIKILTTHILDFEKFWEYKSRFEQEMQVAIEIKRNIHIHDRYLICGNRAWTIGTSVKDLGRKDTLIREVSEIATSLTDLFNVRWNEGETVSKSGR